MLKHRNEQIQLVVRGIDVAISVASFFGAYWIRQRLPGLGDQFPIVAVEALTWMLALSLILHSVFLYPALGFYKSLRSRRPIEIVSMVAKSALIEFFVLGAAVFLYQAKTTPRSFFVVYLVLNYGIIMVEKMGGRILLSTIRKRGYNFRQVLIVGRGQTAAQVMDIFRSHKHWGYVIAGSLTAPTSHPDSGNDELGPMGVHVLGTLDDLLKVVRSRTIDEVVFALERIDKHELEPAMRLCEMLGIPARIALGDWGGKRVTFNSLAGMPVITYYTTLMTPAQAFLKRSLDVVLALFGLIVTLPLLPWIAWKIRRESPGPVFFKQLRVGENGRSFRCYKFRTMSLDAEARKQELLKNNEMEGPIFKIKDDPRIFPFGAFLRRTSLDELPQLFNVVRGDMSMVGTRPPTPDEVSRYAPHYRRRLSIRPGLTGMWQVSGRNQIRNFEDILALDLKYIDRWSIWMDFKILFKTIWVVLFRRGAN